MNEQKVSISQCLEVFLNQARENGLDIEGDSNGRWFLINNVKTGESFDTCNTKIMIRFSENSNDPIILVPENLSVKKHSNICPYFIEKTTYISGWKPLCPYMFQDIDDEMLEFIACLMGFMAKPSLCGLMGCEGKNLKANISENSEQCIVALEDSDV